MFVDYSVIDMGCFDDYPDAAPHAKKMRGNVITTFLLHVVQFITFNQTKFHTETLSSKGRLKTSYLRLVFKVIKYFATSPHF